jgi:hypothetical protein
MEPERPFPSSIELVLDGHAQLVDLRHAKRLALEAAVAAMAPATRAAITADLRCFLNWCKSRRPAVSAVPAEPETLVHYLHWLARGSRKRAAARQHRPGAPYPRVWRDRAAADAGRHGARYAQGGEPSQASAPEAGSAAALW